MVACKTSIVVYDRITLVLHLLVADCTAAPRCTKEDAVRLPDEVRKCIFFLGHRNTDGRFAAVGTGFLISYPSPFTDGLEVTFLVTAKHVARRLGADFHIRLNTKAGKADYIELLGARWFCDETDSSVDAAVMLWVPPQEADCLAVGPNLFLDERILQEKRIGTGDEVYVTGLFSPAMGKEKNTPIVRAGHLAMSPPEEIRTPDWDTPTMRSFLIEMRSLGGLSGSPVFVQRSIKVKSAEETGRAPLAAGAIFLLGIVRGHWDVPHMDLDYVSPPKRDRDVDLLNAGIAIVQPGDKIVEIIRQDTVLTLLGNAESEVLERHPHYLDGSSPARVRPEKRREFHAAISVAVSRASPHRRPR
jgi:hypothetical protein